MARPIFALLFAATAAAVHAQGLHVPPPGSRPPGAVPERAPESAPAPAATHPPASPLPRGAVLEELSGVVREVDRTAHRIAVETASGRVTLSFDRNTMVYTPSSLGTVLDVVPGAQIRAGRNADFLVYWVQLRAPAPGAPSPPPGQGTGPAAGAAGPAAESAAPPNAPVTPPPGSATPTPVGQ